MFIVASLDTALAAQNAAVAAESLGLGTVYIGALRNLPQRQAALHGDLHHPERVAELLGLPEHTFAVFGMCVGWEDPAAPACIKPRLPRSVVLHRDRYAPSQPLHDAVGAYDQLMQSFYTSQSMGVPDGGWSLHSAKRVASVAALNGRHVLRQTLARLGFDLK